MPGSARSSTAQSNIAKRRRHNDNDVGQVDATSGEMVKVRQASEVPTACHGTYKVQWKNIRSEGLRCMGHTHIQCVAADLTAPEHQHKATGGYRGPFDVIVYLDVARAIAEGIEFHWSENGLLLTRGCQDLLPPRFFAGVAVWDYRSHSWKWETLEGSREWSHRGTGALAGVAERGGRPRAGTAVGSDAPGGADVMLAWSDNGQPRVEASLSESMRPSGEEDVLESAPSHPGVPTVFVALGLVESLAVRGKGDSGLRSIAEHSGASLDILHERMPGRGEYVIRIDGTGGQQDLALVQILYRINEMSVPLRVGVPRSTVTELDFLVPTDQADERTNVHTPKVTLGGRSFWRLRTTPQRQRARAPQAMTLSSLVTVVTRCRKTRRILACRTPLMGAWAMEPKAAVVVNGLGRFGRDVIWAYVMMERPPFEIVAINTGSLTAKTAAILLEEDRKRVGSDIRVTLTADELVLGDTRFRILSIRKIEEAPWAELGADIIVESVIGKYAVPRAHFHLEAGAARVVIYEG